MQGFQDGMHTVTKQSNYTTNAWNNFTDGCGKKGADFNNSGNE